MCKVVWVLDWCAMVVWVLDWCAMVVPLVVCTASCGVIHCFHSVDADH